MKGREENQCTKPQHDGASTNTNRLLSFLNFSLRHGSLPQRPHRPPGPSAWVLALSAHCTVSP